jgi:hypothetical protein
VDDASKHRPALPPGLPIRGGGEGVGAIGLILTPEQMTLLGGPQWMPRSPRQSSNVEPPVPSAIVGASDSLSSGSPVRSTTAKTTGAVTVAGSKGGSAWLSWIPVGGRDSQLKALTKPTKHPGFPHLPPTVTSTQGEEAALMNPSDSQISALQTGLLCRSIRGGARCCSPLRA